MSMDSNHVKQSVKDDLSDDDDFGDFNTSLDDDKTVNEEATNLTGLVESELPSLSKHWLAALKVLIIDQSEVCISSLQPIGSRSAVSTIRV